MQINLDLLPLLGGKAGQALLEFEDTHHREEWARRMLRQVPGLRGFASASCQTTRPLGPDALLPFARARQVGHGVAKHIPILDPSRHHTKMRKSAFEPDTRFLIRPVYP